MVIARSAITQFLSRDFDNFNWLKKTPRSELMEAIRALSPAPRFKTPSWDHQLAAFYAGVCNPYFMYLMDMGTGKTKVILDLISYAKREGKLKRALVMVPRLMNLDSWVDAVAEHSNLRGVVCSSGSAESKWQVLSMDEADLTMIDYPGLHLALSKRQAVKGKKTKGKYRLVPDEKKIATIKRRYNFICLDECHKLGSHDNLWFSLLRRLTAEVDYCYGLTGTLFGKDPEALWAQFYLVDRGETFGPNLGLFRAAFFNTKMSPWKGVVYTYNQKMDRMLHRMIGSRSLRYEESEVHELPARVNRVINLGMGEEQREHYLRALEGLINANGNLDALDAQWLRMRQIVSGYLDWKDEFGHHQILFKENPKLDKLEAMVEDMVASSKVVICYDYTSTGKMITDKLKQMKVGHEWLYGGTKDRTATRTRFLTDPKCQVLVMNSEAGGTGNDGLQKVAKYMIFYETPTPPTTRQQTIKRIHRPGQTERSFIYDLVMRKSLDAGILEGIREGIDLHDRVVSGKVKKDLLLGL